MKKMDPVDIVIQAVSTKQANFNVNNVSGKFENVVRRAIDKEPRILAFIKGYRGESRRNSLLPIFSDYEICMEFNEDSPEYLSEIEVDDENFDLSSYVLKTGPKNFHIVIDDIEDMHQKIDSVLEPLICKNEGLRGFQYSYYSFPALSDKTCANVSFNYICQIGNLRQCHGKAIYAAKMIWNKILGRAKVPLFIKPFLAFSYLAQECVYDQRAFDESVSNEGNLNYYPSDYVPHLAYGPLVESRGICSGFAWAFKRLMDEAKIECICVAGYLKEDSSTKHQWNMIKIDNQYYHVDPTSTCQGGGVYTQYFLQPDKMMKLSHIWDTEIYPKATGTRINYDYIEDFLVENGNDYLDDGANEKYFFPDELFD